MANIIEEFLNSHEYDHTKTVLYNTLSGVDHRHEIYKLDGNETLDGLALTITVHTAYINNKPVAQDFQIKSNRGTKHNNTVNDVFNDLWKYL